MISIESWVAVVARKDGNSFRKHQDHAAFIGSIRDEVIRRALRACAEWNEGKVRDTYHVYVGQLFSEAIEPARYELVSLPKQAEQWGAMEATPRREEPPF